MNLPLHTLYKYERYEVHREVFSPFADEGNYSLVYYPVTSLEPRISDPGHSPLRALWYPSASDPQSL